MSKPVIIAISLAALGLVCFLLSLFMQEQKSTLRIISVGAAVMGFFILITRPPEEGEDTGDEPDKDDFEDFVR